jgi:hypothetical protein
MQNYLFYNLCMPKFHTYLYFTNSWDMKTKKSWAEKMEKPAVPEVKTLEKAFADLPANCKMLIPTPKLIADYIRQIPKGHSTDVKQMRVDLSAEHNAQYTCPLTTGIFLRIVTERTNEERESGVAIKKLTPVWRVVHDKLPMFSKLSFNGGWLMEMREKEGI